MILVTGGTGYVGTVLVRHLARTRKVRTFDTQHFGNAIAGLSNVESVQGDIRDREAVRRACKGVSAVIHLAGIVTDGLVDMNQAMSSAVNEDGTRIVGEEAVRAGAQRIVYASSSSVYGLAARGDDPVTEDVTPEPQTAYAAMKLAGERILNEMDATVVSVRSATACGPAPRMRLDTVVNVFSKQAWFDKRITVHGGEQWRSNIHVEDVAELYEFMLSAPADKIDKRAFNATRANMKVGDIARLVALHLSDFQRETLIEYQTVPDARSYRMDASMVTRELGWSPARTISDAIYDNFTFFSGGGISDPNADLYFNNKRMADVMKGV